MGATKTPLSGEFRESDVTEAFARERLRPIRWSNAPGDVYASHDHDYHKVLYCLAGSIVFRLDDTGDELGLHPGDRLDIEPRTPHSAVVGSDGVTCIEAPR
jgi:quercetin dioxygenase-like cupin family protein